MADLDFFRAMGISVAATAEEFVAERKRLREARMKWIEDNECPSEYSVPLIYADGTPAKNADGTPVMVAAGGGFFQVGKLKYDKEEYREEYKTPQTHKDPALEKQLLEGIEAVLSEANATGPARLGVLSTESESVPFLFGEEKTPYSPIEDGEDYGQYYERVSSALQREASRAGSATTGHDGVRGTSSVNTPSGRQIHASGDGDNQRSGTGLGSDTEPVHSGQPQSAIADLDAIDTLLSDSEPAPRRVVPRYDK